MKTTLILSLVVLTTAVLARADPLPDPLLETVRRAIHETQAVRLKDWAYTVTAVVNGEKTVERHDPSAPPEERWQLVLKNGRTPSSADLEKYREQRRRGPSGHRPQLNEWIDPSTLRIRSHDEARITCEFRMKSGDSESRPMLDQIKGTLVVLKDAPAVEMLEMVNAGRIKHGATFSLSEFKTRVQFHRDPIRGDPLPVSLTSRIRGRALLVKSLNQDATYHLSDFQRMIPMSSEGK